MPPIQYIFLLSRDFIRSLEQASVDMAEATGNVLAIRLSQAGS